MITIVGGGLAGLSLGIALRRRGVPVNLHEAGVYPRHRVCGEFISGVSQCTFDSLGIEDLFTMRRNIVRPRGFFATEESSPLNYRAALEFPDLRWIKDFQENSGSSADSSASARGERPKGTTGSFGAREECRQKAAGLG